MGLRGIGAAPKKKTTKKPAFIVEVRGETRAERVVSFIQSLPVTSGILAGQRFKLGPWQQEIVRGIYRTEGNRRIVRQALITIPRKNGKTTFTAALALCHLCGPEAEARGEIFSAAAERTQAAIVFREMKAMIQATNLQDRVIIRDWSKSLEDIDTGSIYTALSADVKTKHGFNASMWIYDELAQAPDRKLYDVLNTSGGGRKEPMGIIISTQNADVHSIMSELVDDGERILAGEHKDPTFYPVIFSAPMDADPWSEDTWRACNPGIDSGFRSLEEMRTAAIQAQRIPARESAFRLLYLNQRVAMDERFISRADWEACGAKIDPEKLRGRPCWGGLDLSSTQDLTAFVLYFPEDNGAVLPFFWVPRDRMEEREHNDRVPYPQWHREGLIETTPGRAIDKLSIVRRIAELASQYDIQGIAYDRWGLESFQKLLSDEGIDLTTLPFGQGFRDMGPAVSALEVAILDRTLTHPNHPVLTWNASNAVVEIDPPGNRKISKQRAKEKVDGLVALAMAIGLYSREPKEKEITFDQPMVILA